MSLGAIVKIRKIVFTHSLAIARSILAATKTVSRQSTIVPGTYGGTIIGRFAIGPATRLALNRAASEVFTYLARRARETALK